MPRLTLPSRRPIAAAALLAACVAFAHAAVAQPRDRVDSTLPELDGRERGDRVLSTRPLREASEARLRMELARQNELDRLVNPHRDAWMGYMPVTPIVPLQQVPRYPDVRPVPPVKPSPLPPARPTPLPAR